MKILLTCSAILFLVVACQKFIPAEGGDAFSSNLSRKSHENGNNCLACHSTAGYAPGFFTVAGTVLGEYQNASIEIHRDNFNNEPLLVVPVDQLGNAYTTDAIDFSEGLRVLVRSASGDEYRMEQKLYSGSCNLCHGTPYEEDIIIF